MDWGLFVLILIIFICFTVLLYLQMPNFGYFVENYFIIVIIILFIILIFTIELNNPITTTIYINTSNTQSPLVYQVPYNSDSDYSNLMSASFAGTYSAGTDPVNTTPASDTLIFNYDTFTTTTLLGGKIALAKLPNYQISVTIDPNAGTDYKMDGFLTLSLLCTSSQSISGGFKQV